MVRMASIEKTDLESYESIYRVVDLRPGSTADNEPPNPDGIVVKQYHTDLQRRIGTAPEYSLLLISDDLSNRPLFCNGCVYLPETDELYVMSDLLETTSSSALPTILISKIMLKRTSDESQEQTRQIKSVSWTKLRAPSPMPMPAGACRYKAGTLFCSQGTLDPQSGGLYYMAPRRAPVPVLTSFFHKPFNSIRNVVVDSDGGIWFTDVSVGFELGIRPKPQLPNQVYRFDPNTGDLRVVADGFNRPTGIALDPNNNILYVTDTGAALDGGELDHSRPATIYAFDITQKFGSPFLINKRVFAYAKEGVPTEVICDSIGTVYAACGDGVEIWSPGGRALGLIEVFGGCTSICPGRNDELFICAKQRLWRIQLGPGGCFHPLW